jgi:hypothetical protein
MYTHVCIHIYIIQHGKPNNRNLSFGNGVHKEIYGQSLGMDYYWVCHMVTACCNGILMVI